MAAWSEGDGTRFFIQKSGDQERTEQSIETKDTLRDELEEFARCIRGGGRPETGGAEGLEVIVVLEAMLESVRQGRVVDLDEIRSR
jgi:predicted dehydrogenase